MTFLRENNIKQAKVASVHSGKGNYTLPPQIVCEQQCYKRKKLKRGNVT